MQCGRVLYLEVKGAKYLLDFFLGGARKPQIELFLDLLVKLIELFTGDRF